MSLDRVRDKYHGYIVNDYGNVVTLRLPMRGYHDTVAELEGWGLLTNSYKRPDMGGYKEVDVF